ncbi:MAG: hypothetical protein M1820_005711 [Bogoriella megaspora]|nr:MAG: hypothetical protein M1820_005711 [Bogoriella megaspora]
MDDGLEVVPGTAPQHKPLEYYAHDNTPIPQERNDYPEVVPGQDSHVVQPDRASQFKGEGYFAPNNDDPSPPYSGPNHGQPPNRRRRICGLSFWLFVGLVAALVIIIILAAVLGGVLGTRNSNKTATVINNNSNDPTSSSSSSNGIKPFPAMDGTGIAAVQQGGNGAPITYVQDQSSNIIENIWNKNQDSPETFTTSQKTTVATDAKKGSPIVAMSYFRPLQNAVTRHVVYVDNTNHLKDAVYDTRTDKWVPAALSGMKTQVVGSTSVALAACSGNFSTSADSDDHTLGPAIRLYYGASGDNLLQEMGADISNSTWNWQYWNNWGDINGQSGVACAVHGDILNLYYTNTTTGKVGQSYFDYSLPDVWAWKNGPDYDQLNVQPAAGTAIAASNDGHNTETIIFQLSDSSLQTVTASLNHNATQFESDMSVAKKASQTTKLGNLWLGNGTVWMWQDEDDNVILSGWGPDGKGMFNASLPFTQ